MEIISFDESMVSAAGALLAERHRADRQVFPELPERFEDPAVAARAVEATWRKEGASGVAGVDGDRLLAYLIGQPVIENIWGRSAWIRPPGCAVAPGQEFDVLRDLYAVLAAPWVEAGIFFHFAVMPIANPALWFTWFSLSFGIEQIYAIQALEPAPARRPLPGGFELRKARSEDRPAMKELAPLIWRHQVQAPVWGISLPEDRAGQLEGYAGLVADPEVLALWLAIANGRPLAMQGYFINEESDDDLYTPPKSCYLGVAQTVPEARRRGLQSALSACGLGDAYEHGYRACITDWRSTNLLSSRSWPRHGYRPVIYRMVRRIDNRILWAR